MALDLARIGTKVPPFLTYSRVIVAPMLIWMTIQRYSPSWLGVALVYCLLSDIFDGVIARRLKVATDRLRFADSITDAWFFLCVAITIWISQPAVLQRFAWLVVFELAIQASSYVYDLKRFGRIVYLHAYSAKLWGFSLYLAAFGVLVWHNTHFIWFAFGCGVLAGVDALVIKMILPAWARDVVSVPAALKIRRDSVTV